MMTLVFRFLGVAAALGQRLSRFSVNFVQLNWVVMVGLGALVVFGTKQARDAWVNQDGSHAVSIAEVLEHRDLDHNFVTVAGSLLPVAVFEKTKSSRHSSSTTVESSYLPLIDRQGRRALLVKISGSPRSKQELHDTQLTGMLEPLESGVRERLLANGGRIDDLPIDTDVMLVADEAPGNLLVWAPLTGLAALLLLAMLVTWQKRYVVFQGAAMAGAGNEPPIGEREAGIDLRASGPFRLDAKNRKRFLNVPCGLGRLDSGPIALFSNIDASSSFMGVTTAKRAGTWAILLEPEALAQLEPGFQYVGWSRRPALRVHFRETPSSKLDTALLSCADDAECHILRHELVRLVAAEPAPTAPVATAE